MRPNILFIHSDQHRDLMGIANGTDPAPREHVYAMWHGGQFGSYTQRMIRERRWKYIWNCTAEDELYDLHNDPAERHNRATDPACAETLRRLRERLVDQMDAVSAPLRNAWNRAQLLEGLSR